MSKGDTATLGKSAVLPPGSRWRDKTSWQLSRNTVRHFIASCLSRNMLILSMLSFLLGRVTIVGELLPFGLAFFIAAVRKKRTSSPAIGIWTLAGSISAGHSVEAACYAIVMLLYYRLSGRETRLQRRLRAAPVLFVTGLILVASILALWQYITLYQLMLAGFTVVASFVMVIIFATVFPLLNSLEPRQANEEQLACLLVLLSAAIAGMAQIQVAEYSVRNIAGGFLIMILSQQGGIGLGVSFGAAVGIVAGLNGGSGAAAVAYFAVAALVGGVFHSWGKVAIAMGYLTGCAIAVSYFSTTEQMLPALAEAAIGAVLFLAVPARWGPIYQKKPVTEDSGPVTPDLAIIAASGKLKHVAEVFSDLAATFSRTKVYEPESEDVRQAVNQLGEKLCKNCDKRTYCWEEQFYVTYQAFLDLLSLQPGTKLSLHALPRPLQESCQFQRELLAAAGDYIEQKRVQLFWQKRVLENRAMLAEQMRSVGNIVSALASEIDLLPQEDKQAEACLAQFTKIGGCELETIKISGEGSGMRIVGRKQPCSGEQECFNTLVPLVTELLGKRMTVDSQCGSKVLHRKCRITLTTASRYGVSVGAAAIAKNANTISGDTCSVSEAGSGRIAAIISDGMGSGNLAAKESQAAVCYLEKLLTAGFSIDAAVKSVNAMLLLRMPGECYTTIDVAIFDLFSGEVEFLKTGSAVSYIKRVREVSTVQSTSLPVGIIEQVEIEPQRRKLVPGDTVVLVSDGVAEADRQRPRRDWIANFLRLASDDDPQKLANSLLDQACKLAGSTVTDDMTVLVIKMHERLGDM